MVVLAKRVAGALRDPMIAFLGVVVLDAVAAMLLARQAEQVARGAAGFPTGLLPATLVGRGRRQAARLQAHAYRLQATPTCHWPHETRTSTRCAQNISPNAGRITSMSSSRW